MSNTEKFPPILPEGDYLKGFPQLASFLGVSIPTARKILKEERPPFFKVGKKFFFERNIIREALKKGGPK